MQLGAIGKSSDVPVIAAYGDPPVRRIDSVAAYLARHYGAPSAPTTMLARNSRRHSEPLSSPTTPQTFSFSQTRSFTVKPSTHVLAASRARSNKNSSKHSPSDHVSCREISFARTVEIDFDLNVPCAAKENLAKTNPGEIENCIFELQIAQDRDRLTADRVSADLVAWKVTLSSSRTLKPCRAA